MGNKLRFSVVFTIILCFHFAKGDECDKLGTIIYEDLGCKPILEQGKNCPVKYECSLEVTNGTCLFRGHQIPVGENIPRDLTYGNCRGRCRCREGSPSSEALERIIKGDTDVPVGGSFSCAVLDCPEHFGSPKLEPGCHRTYALDKCCANGVLCETPEEPLAKCKIDADEIVKEGQKFYPPNSCLKCVCPKNFNGELKEPHCMRFKCAAQIRFQTEVIDHCAPFYTSQEDVLCCPDGWVCPTESDKIFTVNPKVDQTSDLRCRFGTKSLKLGEGFETTATVTWSQKVLKAKCECALPPLLTCREINN